MFLLAYRSSIHESTKETPAKVVFGRELRLPCDLEFGAPPQPPQEVKQFTQELKDRLKQIHELVRENLEIASDRMKARYDICADDFKFEPQDKVWFYNPHRKKG